MPESRLVSQRAARVRKDKDKDSGQGRRWGPGSPETPAPTRPLPWLAAVAVAFTLTQLVLVAPGLGLGWDETVYVSQVSPQAPAAFFSAPRARGITFLVAPVAALTTSVEALRVHMAVLSGCGLFLALWVWRRMLPAPVLAVAGTAFASLWITAYYGPQAMPNLWVAYGALAATGCFLRAARDAGDRRAMAGLGAAVAFVALMRPSDALWLVLPLAVVALIVGASRRPVLLAVLAVSMGLGCAEWIIEAYLRYGGLSARLRRASEIQGHLGWYLAVDDHVRALGGRTLCRPCDVPWRNPVTALWFFAVPLLVAGGVRAATRARSRFRFRTEILTASLVGLSLAVPYLFTVDYAAPRFLLPAYALLSLPVALCLVGVFRARRPAAVVLVAVAVAAHLAIQYVVLNSVVQRVRSDRAVHSRIAAVLRAQGVRPPCLITGEEAIRVAFRNGCASRQPGGHDGSITPAGIAAAARRQPVVVLLSGDRRPPSYARTWRVQPLPALGGRADYRAYLSP
ncbi:hypothetical protein ACWGI8_31815 [Streptomyces sp. NPDC054841]